jgi:hypothetical protein
MPSRMRRLSLSKVVDCGGISGSLSSCRAKWVANFPEQFTVSCPPANLLRQNLNANVPKASLTNVIRHRRMTLQGDRAFRQPRVSAGQLVFGAGVGHLVIEHLFPIQFDRHLPIFADDLLRVPDIIGHGRRRESRRVLLVVCRRSLRSPSQLLDAVKTARPAPVAVAVVHLAFDAQMRKPGLLKPGMKINARITSGISHHLHPQVEILERVMVDIALVKQMRRAPVGAFHDNHAVLRGEDAGVVAHPPTLEALAVKKADEPFLHRGRLGRT